MSFDPLRFEAGLLDPRLLDEQLAGAAEDAAGEGLAARDAGEPFVLGINYWPRRKAMGWWSDFDAAEVAEEFSVIAELGFTVVRIFLLWDDWQPTPDTVSTRCLDHLVAVADAAETHGLGLDVTFFTGHMSGPNWAPRWLLGGSERPRDLLVATAGRYVDQGYRNPYRDPQARRAQRLLVGEVCRVLRQHPAIWMWNLANEPDLFGDPGGHEHGAGWVRDIADAVRRADPDHPVTCGLHLDSLVAEVGFWPGEVFAELDVAVMHAYPQYSSLARQPLDPALVPFAAALTATLAGKPVLAEEFGGCTAPPGEGSFWLEWELPPHAVTSPALRRRRQFMANEDELALYAESALANLVRSGATGAMWWCFADYASELWDRPPCDTARHERFFGVVRPDGTLKPHAEAIRRFAAGAPAVQPIPEWATFTGGRDGQPLTDAELAADRQRLLARCYRDFVEALETR